MYVCMYTSSDCGQTSGCNSSNPSALLRNSPIYILLLLSIIHINTDILTYTIDRIHPCIWISSVCDP